MIVEHAQLLNAWRVWPNLSLRVADILQVLPATRIGTVSRRHKGERIANAIRSHATQRVRQQWVPVSITPVNRKFWPVLLQFFFECRNQVSILLVDRTHATKQLVMMRDLEHALTRHIPPPQNI